MLNQILRYVQDCECNTDVKAIDSHANRNREITMRGAEHRSEVCMLATHSLMGMEKSQ